MTPTPLEFSEGWVQWRWLLALACCDHFHSKSVSVNRKDNHCIPLRQPCLGAVEEWARALGWLKIAPGDDDGPLIQQLLSEGLYDSCTIPVWCCVTLYDCLKWVAWDQSSLHHGSAPGNSALVEQPDAVNSQTATPLTSSFFQIDTSRSFGGGACLPARLCRAISGSLTCSVVFFPRLVSTLTNDIQMIKNHRRSTTRNSSCCRFLSVFSPLPCVQ